MSFSYSTQEVLAGSSTLVSSSRNKIGREEYILKHMAQNRAYDFYRRSFPDLDHSSLVCMW